MDLSKLSDKQLEIALKVAQAAEKQGLNPDFVLPMVMVESGFDDKATSKKGAKGVMQLMPDTAKALGVNLNDVDENIEGGVRLLKELVSNKNIGSDPYKVLAAYNTSTETRNKFLESGDLTVLPDETINHMLKVSERFGGELPQVVAGAKTEKEAPAPEAPAPQVAEGEELVDEKVGAGGASNIRVPRALAGLAGAAAGATAGAGAAVPAAALRAKYDAAQLIASYPDAMAAFKAGKSPSDVLNIALQHTAPSPRPDLPTAGGPLTGTPAGGRMTQNWVGSQDAEGRYTDVGMKARDQAEAHQMKRAAMAAEDKISQIAPEFRADPNRANLFIPQSAGRGPSPRFGGTPNAPLASAAPVVEKPTVMGGLAGLAKHYTPYLKWPVMGGLAGFGVGQGAADVYNRLKENKPGQAAVSAAGTAAATAAPFVGTAASIPLTGAGALLPAYLYMQDNPEAKERFLKGMSGKSAYANRGFGLD